MQIRFWGVRGSTPTPEPRNARYGGNTSCLEVRLANGSLPETASYYVRVTLVQI